MSFVNQVLRSLGREVAIEIAAILRRKLREALASAKSASDRESVITEFREKMVARVSAVQSRSNHPQQNSRTKKHSAKTKKRVVKGGKKKRA